MLELTHLAARTLAAAWDSEERHAGRFPDDVLAETMKTDPERRQGAERLVPKAISALQQVCEDMLAQVRAWETGQRSEHAH